MPPEIVTHIILDIRGSLQTFAANARIQIEPPVASRNRDLSAKLYRRILGSKGTLVLARRMQQSFCGALRSDAIKQAMERLSVQGLGRYDESAGAFYKCTPDQAFNNPNFVQYGLTMYNYNSGYFQSGARYKTQSQPQSQFNEYSCTPTRI